MVRRMMPLANRMTVMISTFDVAFRFLAGRSPEHRATVFS